MCNGGSGGLSLCPYCRGVHSLSDGYCPETKTWEAVKGSSDPFIASYVVLPQQKEER